MDAAADAAYAPAPAEDAGLKVEPAHKTTLANEADKGRQLSWSAYMGDADDGDSPWASLDAIADGAGHLAKPFPTQAEGASDKSHEDAAMVAAVEAALSRQETVANAPSKVSPLAASHSMNATSASPPPPRLTHVDPATGSASMVDVSSKATTPRTAEAVGRVSIPRVALELLRASRSSASSASKDAQLPPGARLKGPVLHTAQLAGIMGAKRTAELIPLCHGITLAHVDVSIDVVEDDEEAELPYLLVRCTATTAGQTGVEMEALTGVHVACLTLWDMLKSVAGRDMVVSDIMVTRKSGGKSGDWTRQL